jgi:tetratricopeptide (TPR) repeat protein
MAGLAGLYQGLKDLKKSREYYIKQTEIEPENPIPYYAVASTDWYRIRDKSVPMTDEEKVQAVEEGLQYVEKALERDPKYQDALAYKNLLLRDKAAATKDPAEAKRLLDEADVYFKKALEARNETASKAAEEKK